MVKMVKNAEGKWEFPPEEKGAKVSSGEKLSYYLIPQAKIADISKAIGFTGEGHRAQLDVAKQFITDAVETALAAYGKRKSGK